MSKIYMVHSGGGVVPTEADSPEEAQEIVNSAAEAPAEEADEGDDEEEGFDPKDHNIPAVLEFVGQDAELAAEVAALEAEGENRSTLLEQLAVIINA